MKLNNHYYFFSLLLLLWACGGERKAKNAETEPSEQAVQTSQQQPKELDFYLETSGSMSGFLTGSTEFKATVSSLVAQLERVDSRQIISQPNYMLIPEGTKTDTVPNAEQLQDLLTNNKLAQGKSSLILNIFKMLRDRSSKDKINVFVSDCIISDFKPENRDIMQSQASMIFNDLASKGMAVSVYAFTSAFNGRTIKQNNRPFYIWLIGESQALENLGRKLKKAGFNPQEELHQGFTFNSSPAYQLLNSTNKSGEGEFMPANSNQSLKILRMYRNKPIQFALGMDLSSFPERSINEKSFDKLLSLKTGPNITAELVETATRNNIGLKGKDRQRADDNNLTHFATIEISELKSNSSWIELQLQRPAPADWHEAWSTLATKQPEGKTYGFQYMINGLRSAYRSIENQPYMSIRVEITKD
jgi:hypothetical protein